MNGIIYQATNIVNRKSYIGKTIRGLKRRKAIHYAAKDNYHNYFHNALKKYKKEDWNWSILAVIPIEDLAETEQLWIAGLNTFYNGYNLTLGGEGCLGKIVSDLTKLKMSKKQIGKTLSSEHRQKISSSQKGKKATEETKIKMSQAKIGKKLSMETKCKMSQSAKGRIPWNKGKFYNREVNT